ncbi:GNAT family N-acetyltransferase [uncultured Friedmanniella sp.]|uniref:GNAT family N-acetyltransferase n=1 Tax=uncultured Friedmanniella sp. TaxID=335381 RepID=UPI0035CA9AF4
MTAAGLVGPLVTAEWPALWPMLQAMGTGSEEPAARARFERLRRDPCWSLVGCHAGDRLVGYAAAQDRGTHVRTGDEHRTARLHDLYVDPAVRRQGLGRSLMAAVVDWAGGRVRYLEWQAHETRSAPFYLRLGYRGDPCPQPEYPTFEIDFGSRPPLEVPQVGGWPRKPRS